MRNNNIHKWRYSRFDTGTKMTRVEGDKIAIREMNLWERIIHGLFYYKGKPKVKRG